MGSSQNTQKLIISQNDKSILDEINLKRNLIEDGLVWEAFVSSIHVWLPSRHPDGVIDIGIPLSDTNEFGFKDKWEAVVRKDTMGVYRLYERDRGKDIPKHFFPTIEDKLLLPFSMGVFIPYNEHLYGKGLICKIANLKAKEFRLTLEDVEILSPYENAIFLGYHNKKDLPKSYKRGLSKKDDDYETIISRGENERIEFKSSVRWDYRKNCVNKEIEKTIVKTIAGFLNSNGGTLFIGVDDNKNIVGITQDLNTLRKKSHDGFQLFIGDLISQKIGKQYNNYIKIKFPEIKGRTICVLFIEKSKIEAFVKENGKNIFYIRSSNSTRELDAKEAFGYILINFKGRHLKI